MTGTVLHIRFLPIRGLDETRLSRILWQFCITSCSIWNFKDSNIWNIYNCYICRLGPHKFCCCGFGFGSTPHPASGVRAWDVGVGEVHSVEVGVASMHRNPPWEFLYNLYGHGNSLAEVFICCMGLAYRNDPQHMGSIYNLMHSTPHRSPSLHSCQLWWCRWWQRSSNLWSILSFHSVLKYMGGFFLGKN